MLPFVFNLAIKLTIMAAIVQTRTFLTLLGGGPTHFSHVKQSLRIAPILVCADGGADHALKFGHTPEAVIGDFDSLSDEAREQIPADRLHHVAEQDSTDFEKCLQRIEAPAILALGFVGARLDHTLAACAVLTRYPDKTVILVGEEDICFLAPERFSIELPIGTVFSIFPMGPVRGKSSGLKYPIDGLELAPLGQGGTSNEVTGPVEVELPGRMTLLILPAAHLEDALHALTGASDG